MWVIRVPKAINVLEFDEYVKNIYIIADNSRMLFTDKETLLLNSNAFLPTG